MSDVLVRAVFDYSNTAGSQYSDPLPNGGAAIQQADGFLITRRSDGTLRVTPLYTQDDLAAAIATAASGKAASGQNTDITSLSGLTTALSVAQGGTGATTTAGARGALNLNNVDNTSDAIKAAPGNPVGDAIGGKAAKGANSDITSLSGLTTPLSQAQGGSGAATLADASVTIPGISAPHILGDFLKNPISLERFGCRGDFNGTTGFDNQTTLPSALASGEKLTVPPGRFYLCGVPLSVVNRPIAIDGPYSSGGLVFPSDVPGLSISQDNYKKGTYLKGLSLLTLGTEASGRSALTVRYTVDDSGNFRNHPRCIIDDLICGGWDYKQNGWDVGADIIDVHNLLMRSPYIFGRRNGSVASNVRESYGTMTAGIRNTGTSTDSRPSDALIERPYIYNAKIGIQSRGEVEGFAVLEPIIIAVLKAIDIDNSTERPWGRIIGGTLSALDVMIAARNCPTITIRDVLFYKGLPVGVMPEGSYPSDLLSSSAGTVLIYLDNCVGFRLSDLEGVNNATTYAEGGAHIGAVLKNSFAGEIRKFYHQKPTVSVYQIGTSGKNLTEQLITSGSYTGSPVSEYLDRSTGGGNIRTDGNKPAGTATNASAITLSGTPDKSVSVFIPNAQAGQRYRFEAHVEAGISTGGEINFSIMNDGGGAGGAWDASAGYIAERRAAAAGSTQACSVGGIYTVTSRGSIVAKLSLQMPAGAGSVGAGKAQMSATLL
ncbi:hypothetical protein [Methylobacterium sp. yr596]|uniref:hypothetical protein n=1 Tax=Methylobacterium sp. yr596 TaxID=1761800 RepID=UPI0008EFFDEF|nr:hypothetical protein [Methylobacterium sp. yr596]SFF76584.1 hypothetical protein SAMN04487844_1473 [Methylobacterium sp. yr596]